MLDQMQKPNLEGTDAPVPQRLMQRMVGQARIELGMRNDRVSLFNLHQSGSAKVFLPKVHNPVPEVVFLNTAGGLTGGDDIRYRMELGAGARAMATTQTAERAYRSTGDKGHVDVSISVAGGASLDWLPQETILFDGSNMARRTNVELAGDARILMLESVVLGRAAMGETVERLGFSDWREVRRDGEPVWIEPFALSQDILNKRESPVTLSGERAFATLALIEQGAEDAVERMRTALAETDAVEGAVSGWNGKCIMRLRAADAFPLRRAVSHILRRIRAGNLPRVWQE